MPRSLAQWQMRMTRSRWARPHSRTSSRHLSSAACPASPGCNASTGYAGSASLARSGAGGNASCVSTLLAQDDTATQSAALVRTNSSLERIIQFLLLLHRHRGVGCSSISGGCRGGRRCLADRDLALELSDDLALFAVMPARAIREGEDDHSEGRQPSEDCDLGGVLREEGFNRRYRHWIHELSPVQRPPQRQLVPRQSWLWWWSSQAQSAECCRRLPWR